MKKGIAPETESLAPNGEKPVEYIDTLEDDMNEFIGEL
jgi:hypothetical protein